MFGRYVQSKQEPDEIPPAIKAYIDRAVHKVSRDLVGRRDFALLADGGRILPELTVSGNDESSRSNGTSPEAAITDSLRVGNCWTITGSVGQLGIRLPRMVALTHASIDHIPREIAADIGRAPRTMILWGSIDGEINKRRLRDAVQALDGPLPTIEGRSGPHTTCGHSFVPLAYFDYDIRAPAHVQTFALFQYIIDSQMSFGVVVLEVLRNWGAEDTCLYRLRLHGQDH